MFTGPEAQAYGAKIRARVPGYQAMHELIAAALLASTPERAKVLIVGAGDGEDLLALARAGPSWTFTALDPEQDMIALAKARAKAAGIGDRVRFHVGYAADLDDADFDAAAAVLVGHFLPDDGARAGFLAQVAGKLRPRGALALADLADMPAPAGAYRAWLIGAGLEPALLAKTEQRMAAEFHPLGEARLAELLDAAGFAAPTRLYQALGYAAYLSIRRA